MQKKIRKMYKIKSLILLVLFLSDSVWSEDENLIIKDHQNISTTRQVSQLITSTSMPEATINYQAITTPHGNLIEEDTEKYIKKVLENENSDEYDDSTTSTVAYYNEMASSSIPAESILKTTKTELESPTTVINETQSTASATTSSEVHTETTTNEILCTTNNESLPTTSEDFTTLSDFTTSTIPATTEFSTTELTSTIETTTIDPPDNGCRITFLNHTLSDDNFLTVRWNFSEPSCTNNSGLTISLKDINCENSCVESGGNNCFNVCNTFVHNLTNQLSYFFNTSLRPCANYSYTLSINLNTSIYFLANEKIGTFENLTVIDYVAKTYENSSILNLNITWNYQYPECNENFTIKIYYDETEHPFSNDLTTSQYIYPNVSACYHYDISVTLNKMDITLNTSIDTRRVNSSAIRNVNVKVSEEDNSAEITWEHPIYGARCFEAYYLSLYSEYDSNFKTANATAKLSYFVLNYQCVNYTVSIKTLANESDLQSTTNSPTTTANYSSPSPEVESFMYREQEESRQIRSKSVVFTTAEISQLTAINKTDTSFSLSVRVDVSKNKCEIEEFLFTCVSFTDESTSNQTLTSNFNEANATVEGLIPYRNYSCLAYVLNEAGWSENGTDGYFVTKQGKPNAPVVTLDSNSITSNQFTLKWKEPTEPKGIIDVYAIHIERLEFLYYNPEYCNAHDNDREFKLNLTNIDRNYTFNDALAFSKYSVSVQAINVDQVGEKSSLYLKTLEDKSDVANFSIIEQEISKDVEFDEHVNLNWKYPCFANGNITKFLIYYNTTDQEYDEVDIEKEQENYIHVIKLNPNHKYTIKLMARSEKNDGKESSMVFQMTPGIPSISQLNISKNVTVHNIAKQYVELSIPLNFFVSSVGSIEHVALLVNQERCGDQPERIRGLNGDDDISEKPFWTVAVQQSCTPQYYAEEIRHIRSEMSKSLVSEQQMLEFNIGKSNCEDSTETVCNGPLKSGTTYEIVMRFYTGSGFADSDYITFSTHKEVPILVIIIVFLVIMCIVFVIGFYITYKKPKYSKFFSTSSHTQLFDSKNYSLSNSNLSSQFDRKDVPVQNFEMYCNEMLSNENEKIKEEYKAIQFFSEGLDKTIIASKANEKCNRYANISPFDNNRVVLNDDEHENDYINASFVNGYYYAKEYIAAQGPKPNTAHDFWRMVLQYKTESIVMLTSLVENNKVKCHEYFPKLNGRVSFDNIRIVCTSEQNHSNYVKRILEIEKHDTKLIVKHYFFCKWLDHSACNAVDLIDFVKIVRMERERPSENVIVHCSAGVGRTGTFIAADILMQRIKQEKKVNIFDLVKQLRKQRMKMVQTFDQYSLLYNAALVLSATQTKQPKVLQNIAMYFENIELFKNWRRREIQRDNNENIVKANDKESVL